MEGSRSKWSARCTSTLFSQLIGIIIGEIGQVVSEEKRTQTATSQTSKFPKSKYFVTLTCSHGGVKIKIKYMVHIYTVPSVDWYHHWRNRSSSFGGEANTKYYPSGKIINKIEVFVTLTCSHEGVKVKMKCMLHIYIVPSVDWCHHWRNRSRSFGGEANTNYYPSAEIICDRRTDGRKDGHADYYMAALRGHNNRMKKIPVP